MVHKKDKMTEDGNYRIVSEFCIDKHIDAWYFVLGNIHNGYYYHQCEVILNDECIFESWV